GASDTTERLSLRWSPIPSAVLRLVTHAPLKWRAAVLTALMVTALVLLYVSRSPSPVAAPANNAPFAGATLDQVLGFALPASLNGALVAQRDSTLAARDRARRAGPRGPSRVRAARGRAPPPPRRRHEKQRALAHPGGDRPAHGGGGPAVG